MRAPLAAPALTALLLACAAPAVGAPVPGSGQAPLEPTLTSISANILVPRCSSTACHGGSGNAPIDLGSKEAARLGMVNASSTETDLMPVVAPGEPDRSYLMLKLLGTQAEAGCCDAMPPSREGDPLSDEQISAIANWIANGAQDD